jgi:hypothetical protein
MGDEEIERPEEAQSQLWDEAWSRPELPEEEPIRPREQWTPGVRNATHVDSGGRPQRRHLEVDTHHERFALEPPPNGREPLAGINAPRRSARAVTHITQPAPHAVTPPASVRRPPARTGALARRGTVVGYRKDRGPLMGTLLVLLVILLVALAAVAGWWFLARPRAASAAPPARTIVCAVVCAPSSV